jgi:putrescine transport system ATP-binding protein
MMFQSYALFPHMTVAENVGFGLRQEGLPKAERSARVAAMLDLVKLGRLAQRKPQQLSGGERQRVALARALAQEPKLVLLDEPLAALDRKLREETRFELVRIQQRIGITFLMVTHDQEEAMSMASRIAVMAAGKVVQLGTPQEIYETPKSRFVADFIGGINLFEGQVLGGTEGTVVVVSADAGGRLLIEHAPLRAGSAVTVAVRPEKIVLNAPATLGNRLEGVIRGIAYRGEASTLEVELSSGKWLRVSIANNARQPRSHAIGDRVAVGWDPAAGVVLTP